MTGKKEWENIESTNRAVGACTSDLRRKIGYLVVEQFGKYQV